MNVIDHFQTFVSIRVLLKIIITINTVKRKSKKIQWTTHRLILHHFNIKSYLKSVWKTVYFEYCLRC